MDPKSHWEAIYGKKRPEEVSWYQPEATLSLELIRAVASLESAIVDVGGGASTLVDGLLRAGYRQLTILDLSVSALNAAQRRLGASARMVSWREGDVLTTDLGVAPIDVWHDRAVFHFLTDVTDRERYIAQVRRAVRVGGHVLVATFAEDGPSRCSGLEVARYSPQGLHGAFGSDFRLIASRREEHLTPRGARQAFTYCLCRFEPAAHVRPAA